jgi:hypothetical protein
MTEPLALAINLLTDDNEWTKQIIEDFDNIDDKGPDGEVPMQPAFAQERIFWEIAALGLGMGCVMGFASLGFMNAIDKVIIQFLLSW